ncbi:MAG: response regulator [Actinomycetota bacterium]
MIRVVVVEDHTLVRQSLVKAVSGEPDFDVVAETGRGDDAVELALRWEAEVVLLDINLPGEDGLRVAERLKQRAPEVRIVFLTMHDDDAHIRRAIELGADGYLPKSASTEELLQALRAVADGGSYLTPAVARRVMELASGRGGSPTRLTDRELEILRLLASGARTNDVAERIYLSVKTVKNHLTSIYAKLGVQTAAQAVSEAYRLALVTRPGA